MSAHTTALVQPAQKTVALSVGLITSVLLIVASFSTAAGAVTTTVSSAIGSTISLFNSSGTVNIPATPTTGGVQTISNDTVTVSTNDAAGYTLKLAETTAAATSLTSGGSSIPASSGTQASPVVQAVNTWGYRVDGVGGFGSGPTSAISNGAISGSLKFAAVPASTPDTLKTTSSTASNDTTSVWYGVAVNTSTPSGTYTNSVTYTATAN